MTVNAASGGENEARDLNPKGLKNSGKPKKGLLSPFFIAEILSLDKFMRNISHTPGKVLTSPINGNIFPI